MNGRTIAVALAAVLLMGAAPPSAPASGPPAHLGSYQMYPTGLLCIAGYFPMRTEVVTKRGALNKSFHYTFTFQAIGGGTTTTETTVPANGSVTDADQGNIIVLQTFCMPGSADPTGGIFGTVEVTN